MQTCGVPFESVLQGQIGLEGAANIVFS